MAFRYLELSDEERATLTRIGEKLEADREVLI